MKGKSRYFEEMTPGALARYYAKLRALTPAQRAEVASRLSAAVRMAAETALRQRHPHASDEEIRCRLAVRLYGRAVALQVFGSIPADAQ
ncbi:MAG: hypothetical protein HY901_05060 [Deltaproteobacteria bacterium]|nr:hypothetical protein [Deltaproteobacteria bacterium]